MDPWRFFPGGNHDRSPQINTFIRSLHLPGLQGLPGSLNFNRVPSSNPKDWTDQNTTKSLNKILSNLNESVNQVIDSESGNPSDSSSFSSFRSSVDENDPAVLNDLINLISSTAHELQDIGKSTGSSGRNVNNPPNSKSPTKITQSENEKSGDSRRNETRIESGTDVASISSPSKIRNQRENNLDLIFSDPRNPDVKRAQLNAESLERLRQMKTPEFLPSVLLRLEKTVTISNEPKKINQNSSDWKQTSKPINFDDELWPRVSGPKSGNDFPGFFTGALRFRTGERKMSPSRSSPIFLGASEALEERPVIVVPTRDVEEVLVDIKIEEAITGSSGGEHNPTKMSPKNSEKPIECKKEDVERKLRNRGKVLEKKTGRRKISVKLNDQDFSEEVKNLSEEDANSSSPTPRAERRTPIQRFMEESMTMRSENERMGVVKVTDDDKIETQIGISSKICRSNNRNLMGNGLNTVAKPSEMVIPQNTRFRAGYNVLVAKPEKSENRGRSSSVTSNCSVQGKCKNSGQRIWRPAGNVKDVPSSSSTSAVRQSRVAQLASPRAGKLREQSMAKSSEAMVKSPITGSKTRPGSPKKVSTTRIMEHGRGDGKSMEQERTVKSSQISNCRTSGPVPRAKTFVCGKRRETNNSSGSVKQLSTKTTKNRSAVKKFVDLSSPTDAEDAYPEQSQSDCGLSSNSNLHNQTTRNFNSNDSIGVQAMQKEKLVSQNSGKKLEDKHAQSLRMLKNILGHHSVSVNEVNKQAREIRSKILNETTRRSEIPAPKFLKKSSTVSGINRRSTDSKTLFEKLAVLTETSPERGQKGSMTRATSSREQSIISLDSFTSCSKSMTDAAEQCSMTCEDSTVESQTSILIEKSCGSDVVEEKPKEVSNVFTETDEEYRRRNYVDAALSPSPSEDVIMKSCNVAETQTQVNVTQVSNVSTETQLLSSGSKETNTDPTIQETTDTSTETQILLSGTKETSTDLTIQYTTNVSTETQLLSPESKETTTDPTIQQTTDVSSQSEPSKASREIASGKEFSNINYSTRAANTDYLMKSRGICATGPPKIDNTSQFNNSENLIDSSTGNDHVNCISEHVNTERQDHLFEDRSVAALKPRTIEESSQIYPALKVTDTAVGEFTVETPEMKSLCSSNSSLVVWRPTARSSFEKFGESNDLLPKEAILAMEIASDRAWNLQKAIGIYKENFEHGKFEVPIIESRERIIKANLKLAESDKSSIKLCGFCNHSQIKYHLKENLEKIDGLESSEKSNEIPVELPTVSEKIKNLMNDILTEVVKIETNEFKDFYSCDTELSKEDDFVQPMKFENFKAAEERNSSEEKLRTTNTLILKIPFVSRNSLLTFVYGVVCSLVFWALQFSITCDSG